MSAARKVKPINLLCDTCGYPHAPGVIIYNYYGGEICARCGGDIIEISTLAEAVHAALKNVMPPVPLQFCDCSVFQRRLESSDINGWHRCQKCRGYVSRERVEDGR